MRRDALVLFGVIGVGILIAVIWFLWGSPDTYTPQDFDTTPFRTDSARDRSAAVQTELSTTTHEAPPPSTRKVVAPAADRDPRPDAYRKALSGITGRVVEADGQVVPEMDVTLVEIKVAEFMTSLPAIFEAPAEMDPVLEVASAVTDEEGRFLLRGTRPRAFHGLAVDQGGPRATLRILDAALQSGELYDVGDIVLSAGVTFVGRVTDQDDQPVVGALVRATTLPAMLLQAGIQQIDGDSKIVIMESSSKFVFELPDWVARQIDKLPIPTTRTDEEGRFRIEGLAPGLVTTIVSHPDFAVLSHGPTPTGQGPERDLGALVVVPGRTQPCRILDTTGRPVPGASVIAGAVSPIGVVAVARYGVASDDTGTSRVDHLPASGGIVIAARQDEHQHWTVVGPDYTDASVDVVLPALRTLTVLLRDETQGVVPDADLRIRPVGRMGGTVPPILAGYHDVEQVLTRVEDGRYEITRLSPGRYELVARARDRATAIESVNVGEENAELTIVLKSGTFHTVQVVDDRTVAPVEWADVSVIKGRDDAPALDRRRTGPEGVATVGPVPAIPDVVQNGLPTVVRVEHPAYARHLAVVDLTQSPQVIRLRPGGSLLAQVHYGGAIPEDLYMVSINQLGVDLRDPETSAPILGATDLEGKVRYSNLPAGSYRFMVMSRIFGGDAFTMLGDMMGGGMGGFGGGPQELADGEFEIIEGETTEIQIDVGPEAQGPTGILRGIVLIDGTVASEVRMSTNGPLGRQDRSTMTDTGGRFDFGSLPAGELTVSVQQSSQSQRWSSLWNDQIELAAGEVRELTIEIMTRVIPVLTVTRLGEQPVADMNVMVNGRSESTRRVFSSTTTDAQGRGEITVSAAGEYMVSVNHSEYGKARQIVTASEPGIQELVVLKLDPGVPCRGRVELIGAEVPASFIYLNVHRLDGPEEERTYEGARVDNGTNIFGVNGLQPGLYSARVYTNGGNWSPVEFTLPPGGSTELVLRFTNEPRNQ